MTDEMLPCAQLEVSRCVEGTSGSASRADGCNCTKLSGRSDCNPLVHHGHCPALSHSYLFHPCLSSLLFPALTLPRLPYCTAPAAGLAWSTL